MARYADHTPRSDEDMQPAVPGRPVPAMPASRESRCIEQVGQEIVHGT